MAKRTRFTDADESMLRVKLLESSLAGGVFQVREFYTLVEVAGIFRVHIRTVQRAVQTGLLSAARFGRGFRVSGRDIEDLYERLAATVRARVAAHAKGGRGRVRSSVARAPASRAGKR